MQENTGDGPTEQASNWIDPIVTEALFWVIWLSFHEVLENNLGKTHGWIVASTTDVTSDGDAAEQGKSDS